MEEPGGLQSMELQKRKDLLTEQQYIKDVVGKGPGPARQQMPFSGMRDSQPQPLLHSTQCSEKSLELGGWGWGQFLHHHHHLQGAPLGPDLGTLPCEFGCPFQSRCAPRPGAEKFLWREGSLSQAMLGEGEQSMGRWHPGQLFLPTPVWGVIIYEAWSGLPCTKSAPYPFVHIHIAFVGTNVWWQFELRLRSLGPLWPHPLITGGLLRAGIFPGLCLGHGNGPGDAVSKRELTWLLVCFMCVLGRWGFAKPFKWLCWYGEHHVCYAKHGGWKAALPSRLRTCPFSHPGPTLATGSPFHKSWGTWCFFHYGGDTKIILQSCI